MEITKYSHLTTDELVRLCISQPNLTPLEEELKNRLEDAIMCLLDTGYGPGLNVTKQELGS